MSLVRMFLLSLSALLLAPTVARAADDEICIGWVHEFIDATHDDDKFTVTSSSSCIGTATSIDEGEPFADGKPYRGDAAEWRYENTCPGLERQIRAMTSMLHTANANLPGATKTRDATTDTSEADFIAYGKARRAWEEAQQALAAAEEAYAGVYDVVVETERDRAGTVVVVRYLGYDESTPLGQAVAKARQAEAAARAAMEAAWERWAGGSKPAATTAQGWVDYYSSIVTTIPAELEAARARYHELGCK